MSLLYGSQYNITGGAPGSVNSAHTDFLMANYTTGMQLGGRISAIRRFFCLFVLFDFLFTSFFWIICILVTGSDLWKALYEEIVHYGFANSNFDVVICSGVRFLLIILFYAIIHINHWWLIAITTACSCILMVLKALYYDWQDNTKNTPFVVILLMSSFLLVWAECWFIDFRVLPQEARAKSILEVACANNSERFDEDRQRSGANLQSVRDYLSQYTESIVNFYSPMESPAGSDDEECVLPHMPKKLSSQDAEYIFCGEEASRQSWETLKSSGWNLEKTISHTDVIFSKIGPQGYKIYKLMAAIEANPEVLFKECLHKFESIPDWNKAMTHCSLVQKINNSTDITYQVAAEGPGGIVSARDFVNVRAWSKMGESFLIAGRSIVYPDAPATKKYVRGENGPTCLVFSPINCYPNRCSFEWLLDIDLKGWIPKYVIEQALIHAIGDFLSSIKSYSHILESKPRS